MGCNCVLCLKKIKMIWKLVLHLVTHARTWCTYPHWGEVHSLLLSRMRNIVVSSQSQREVRVWVMTIMGSKWTSTPVYWRVMTTASPWEYICNIAKYLRVLWSMLVLKMAMSKQVFQHSWESAVDLYIARYVSAGGYGVSASFTVFIFHLRYKLEHASHKSM